MSRKNMIIQNKLTIIDQQSIGKYLQELNVNKETLTLTPAEEYNLFVEYKSTGNPKIKERLIIANLRWVITIAKQFNYPKARLEDLISEGNIGLMKAFDKFDTTRGARFLTFATWYIRQEIKLFIDDVLSDVVQPANRYRINRLIAHAELMLRKAGDETPSTEALIEVYMKIKEKTDPVLSVADYNEIRTQTKGFVSMETEIGGSTGDDEMTLASTFKNEPKYAPDAAIVKSDKDYEIRQLLGTCLSPREKEIVEYSFGLNNREEMTLDQLSNLIGITRERVGQLLQGSLIKLKIHKGSVQELCGNEKGLVQCGESTWNKG